MQCAKSTLCCIYIYMHSAITHSHVQHLFYISLSRQTWTHGSQKYSGSQLSSSTKVCLVEHIITKQYNQNLTPRFFFSNSCYKTELLSQTKDGMQLYSYIYTYISAKLIDLLTTNKLAFYTNYLIQIRLYRCALPIWMTVS